jgi:phospholipase/lecithinase/hemolysin
MPVLSRRAALAASRHGICRLCRAAACQGGVARGSMPAIRSRTSGRRVASNHQNQTGKNNQMKPVRTMLAMALAAAAASVALPASAQTYSQTIFFGDSLTDSGSFRPGLIQAVGPSGALLGKFTTNPGLVWSEYVAGFYGGNSTPANQGGTNYAVGGARTGTNGASPFGAIPSLTTQINAHLAANGGRADSNALYTVWGGANDLFTAGRRSSGAGTGLSSAAPSPRRSATSWR